MTDAQMVRRHDLVVALDYGQFYLATDEVDPELVPEVLDRALEGEGIAQSDGVLVVESPHQNNFEMPLAVEVWDAPPADDLMEWQEAFEAHLDVAEAGLTYESPTVDLTEIHVPPGSYHALITGRGFVGRGWPGSTEPGDEWRIRLWPSTGPAKPRRLLGYTEPDRIEADDAAGKPDASRRRTSKLAAATGDDLPAFPYREEGAEERERAAREAGSRICRDLGGDTGARDWLNGKSGSIRIDQLLPRKIGALWDLLAHLDITLTSAPNDAMVGNEFTMSTYDLDEDGFVGPDGEILLRWTALHRPTHVSFEWSWQTNRGGARTPLQMFAGRTELRFELTDLTEAPDTPQTLLRLWHYPLPQEWAADMHAIWLSKIDQWAYQSV